MNQIRIINADVLDGLAQLDDDSVHCVGTSPPYWGLRDYGTAELEGGDPDCDHKGQPLASEKNTLGGGKGQRGPGYKVTEFAMPFKAVCLKCGALRRDKQIGLENTPQEFVDRMCDVFREVRRVLRKDGTLWLNLGDSYAGGGNYRGVNSEATLSAKQRSNGGARGVSQSLGAAGKDWGGAKPKDLVGIPWRVAFALQADGWYLRQDIIWHKPNPMPESVTDRCTKAHEYIFLMTKSAKYSYDADAIKESVAKSQVGRIQRDMIGGASWKERNQHGEGGEYTGGDGKRNKRSVWSITTNPYKGAHFATFPEALVEPCIKAGCPDDGTVPDPFGGAGTSGLVAAKLGRDAILIELNPEYAKIAEERIAGELPLLASVEREKA